jgi:hypothetical protein
MSLISTEGVVSLLFFFGPNFPSLKEKARRLRLGRPSSLSLSLLKKKNVCVL